MRQQLNDLFSGLSERDKKLLLILGVVVLVFVFVKFLLLPQIEKYSELGYKIIERQSLLDQLEMKAAKQKSAKEKLLKSEEQLNELLTLYDHNYEDGSALVTLAFSAQKNQVFIAGVRPESKILKENYIEYPVAIQMRGVYSRILSLVKDIEDSDNLTQIKNLSFAVSKIETKGVSQTQQADSAPPVGIDNLLDVVMYFSVYAHPQAQGRLDEALFKISEWSTGRENNAFNFPGYVSPHVDVPPGGDGVLPGVNIKDDGNAAQSAVTGPQAQLNISELQDMIKNFSGNPGNMPVPPQQNYSPQSQVPDNDANTGGNTPAPSPESSNLNSNETPKNPNGSINIASDDAYKKEP